MRGFVRSPGRLSLSVLILAVLQCAVVSQLGLTMISAAKFQQNQRLELQRSMARYRHLLQHDSTGDGVQVNENLNDQHLGQTSEGNVEEPEQNLNADLSHPEQQSKEENAANPEQTNSNDQQHSSDQPQQQSEERVEELLGEPANDENSNDQPQQQSQEKVEELLGEPANDENSNDQPQQQSEQKVEELLGEPANDENSNDQQQQPSSSDEEEKVEDEGPPFVFPEPYLLGRPTEKWDERRAAWLDANPHMKAASAMKPRVLIVTGSQPNPCHSPVGDNFHIKSLKIKIDYARMHDYKLYYNFAWLDPLFGSYWVKLPIVRALMLTHPEVEWFLWIDSDAVFTDLLFEAPLDTYEGKNMVLWGWPDGFYKEKNWMAINAGVFLLRNCQWSLDLIDKWSPMGPDGQVRDEYGKILTKFFPTRSADYAADDQSALGYLIFTDEEVKSKVKFIDTVYKMSAYWPSVVDRYEEMVDKYHPGLGDDRWPWITHFTGCAPCRGIGNPDYPYETCMNSFERAYNFADNQVLAYMGLQHESLQSPVVFRTRNETDRPLDLLDVNPWGDRIAQYAEETSGSQ